MQLKLTRSQRESGIISKAVLFCLDARAQLTAEEQANVNRYKLGSQCIYNSEASKRHLAAIDAHAATGTFGGAVKAWGSLALVALNLNITINGLQRGQHIECKDLDELRSAEDAIMDACRRLKAHLDTAATFDGHEVLFSFDDGEPKIISQTASAPPRLIVPIAEGETLAEHSAPEIAPEARADDDGASGTREGWRSERYGQVDPVTDWFDRQFARVNAFWSNSSLERRILIGAVGVLILVILLKACS